MNISQKSKVQDPLMKIGQTERIIVNNYREEDDTYLPNLPPKLKKVEEQLKRFKEKQIQQEIRAKIEEKKYYEEKQALLMSVRDEARDKLRQNHEYIQEKDQESYKNWTQYNTRRAQTVAREKYFEDMFTQKIKDKLERERNDDMFQYKSGIEYFQNQCLKYGVELKKDPNSIKKDASIFNPLTVMSKIREKKNQSDFAKHDREKRQNKMLVEQARATQIINEQKEYEKLISNQYQISCEQLHVCEQILKNQMMEKLDFENNKLLAEKNREELQQKFIARIDQNIQENKLTKDKRQDEFLMRKKMYRVQNLEHRIKKYQQHQMIVNELIDQIINFTEVCQVHVQDGNALEISEPLWRQIQEQFLKDPNEPDSDNPFAKNTSIASSTRLLIEKMPQQKVIQKILTYLNWEEQWNPQQFKNLNFATDIPRFNNQFFGDVLYEIIDKLYPMVPKLPNPQLGQVALRICVTGNVFAGRKTLAKLLNNQYQVDVIDVFSMIKDMKRQVAVPVDDGKKGKKGGKEEVKEIDPVIENFGKQALLCQENNLPYPNQLLVDVILWKLNQLHKYKKDQEFLQEIIANKNQIRNQLEQQKQEYLKKFKYARKKPDDYQIDENFNYYIKGFVIIGFPNNQEQSRLLENALTGYVDINERKNVEAETLKQLSIEFTKPSSYFELKQPIQSGIDLIINVVSENNECVRRSSGRRIDPNTEQIYHMEDNPPPTDVKGLIERLKIIDDEESKEGYIVSYNNEIQNNLIDLNKFYQDFTCVYKQVENQKGESQQLLSQINQDIETILTEKHKIYNKMIEENETQQKEEQLELQKDQNVNDNQNNDNQNNDNQNNNNQNNNNQNIDNNQNIIVDEQYDNIEKLVDFTNCSSEQAKLLLKQWQQIQKSYSIETSVLILKLDENKQQIQQEVQSVQQKFLNEVERQDASQLPLRKFQENLNRFLQDQPGVAEKDESIQKLEKHLNNIWEKIWVTLEEKKNLLVLERLNLIENDWIQDHLEKIKMTYSKLMQAEVNKTHEIANLISNIEQIILGNQPNFKIAYNIISSDNFEKQSIQTYDSSSQKPYELIKNIYQQSKDLLDNLKQRCQNNSISPSFRQLLNQAYDRELLICEQKCETLKEIMIMNVKKIINLQQSLLDKFNNWIIEGLKLENQNIHQMVQQAKQCLKTRSECSFQGNMINLSKKEKLEQFI